MSFNNDVWTQYNPNHFLWHYGWPHRQTESDEIQNNKLAYSSITSVSLFEICFLIPTSCGWILLWFVINFSQNNLNARLTAYGKILMYRFLSCGWTTPASQNLFTQILLTILNRLVEIHSSLSMTESAYSRENSKIHST